MVKAISGHSSPKSATAMAIVAIPVVPPAAYAVMDMNYTLYSSYPVIWRGKLAAEPVLGTCVVAFTEIYSATARSCKSLQ